MSIALELIALGIGASFIIWSFQHKGHGHLFAKIIGLIIMIIAITDLSCTIYSTTLRKNFRHHAMMNKPMDNMMNNEACQCPMMNRNANTTANH